MSRREITSGSAPILWSTVDDAFRNINLNFAELYTTVGGGAAFDFSAIETDLSPKVSGVYSIGSPTKRWKEVWLSGNSIIIGDATISSDNGTITLPSGSTVGGLPIRDPNQAAFKNVAVSGQGTVVANNVSGTLTLVGSGISITTNAGTDTVTFTNAGITNVTAGTSIGVSITNGNATISNTGVTSMVAGLGVTVSSSTGAVTVANAGIVGIEAGIGISVGSRDPVTGKVVITNTAPATGILAFGRVSVAGQTQVIAGNQSDTVTYVAGTGLTITTNLSKQITFTNAGVTSLTTSSGLSTNTSATGAVTITNTGVTALAVSGTGLSINASTGSLTVTSNATSTNTVSTVVARDSSGNFSAGTITATLTGNVNGNVTGGVSGLVTGTAGSSIIGNVYDTNGVDQIDYPRTNRFYINPARTDAYTATGNPNKPYKTFASCYTAIKALITAGTITPADTNPIFIILQGNLTENITLDTGHIFLVGDNGGIHSPIYLFGTVTISGTVTGGSALNSNRFSIQGLAINATAQKACIYFTGSNAQRLLMQDVWVTATGNQTGTTPFTDAGGYGIYADCTGTGSIIHGSNIKVSHNGTGDVYCFKIGIAAGTSRVALDLRDVETSGATQVGAVSTGCSMSFTNSELDANGETCLESYGTGSIVVSNSVILNARTGIDSYGIWLHNSGGNATVINSVFSVASATSGSRAVKGVSGTVFISANLLIGKDATLTDYNAKIDTAITRVAATTGLTAV